MIGFNEKRCRSHNDGLRTRRQHGRIRPVVKSRRNLYLHGVSDDADTFMAGDPVVACADAESFYYVSADIDGTNGISGVSLSTSTDGGKTFASPAVAVIVNEPSDSHIVNGAWIAVQPANPTHLST